MFPMTPLQSWALIGLMVFTIVLFVWHHATSNQTHPRTDAEPEEPGAETAPELYDWAESGL